MKTSNTNHHLYYSTEQVETRLRDRTKVLEQYIGTFRGGQIHIVQAPGASAVRVLAEIDEARVEGARCVLRVSRTRQRRRDQLEPWQWLPAVTTIRLDIRSMERLEWGSSRLSFAYDDEGPLQLRACRITLHLPGDPIDPWR